MKRSGAIWLVVGVVAVAAVLMYFVVLPQVRDGKTVEDIARKAGETVKDVKQTVNDAAKQVEDVADGAEELKAAALVKMARIGQDAKGAADEMKAVLDKAAPSAEELAAAKTKLAAALKSAAELKLPEGTDGVAAAAAARVADGAKAALAELEKLPADPAAAKAAFADIQARIISALSGDAAVAPDKAATTTGTKTEEKAAQIVLPAFDILRVEKDGSTVIAGRAEPGAKVEIVDGDKVIASAEADDSGDFAAVLDNPLTSGDHSIVLKSTTKDGKASTSEEVATVSVPKDSSGELLAMVTKPGEASKIITAPEAELAAAKGVTADGVAEDKAATTDVAKAETDTAVATPDLPDTAADIASTPPAVDGEQTAKADADQKQPNSAPEVMVSAVELEGDRIFIAGNTRPGATVRIYADDQAVAEARADDGGRFVADGTIKLAIGNHTIRADVLSADGTKVEFRASVPFFRPEGDLAAVASVDPANSADTVVVPLADGAFDKARDEVGKALALLQGLYAEGKTPTQEELAAARSSAEIALKSLADTHIAGDIDPAVAALARKAAEDAGKALEKLKAVPADVAAFKTALGDVEATVTVTLKPLVGVASADDADRIAGKSAVKDMAADKAKLATDAGLPKEDAGADVSADIMVTAKVDRLTQSTDEAAADTSAAKADDQASVDTASADGTKVIEQAPLTTSQGSVIIRRGDTLWQISRRVYGKGVRYTTIYVANQTQIEDPDRIKPGQIFSMPGKWLDNSEELHKERLNHNHRQ